MAWKATKTPNYNAPGGYNLCLWYVQNVFSLIHAFEYAWQAWQACPSKHTDRDYPNVPVFLYYSPNPKYGHVVVRDANGKVYTTPLKKGATGHLVYNSVADFEKAWGNAARYVGWSEWCNQAVAEWTPDPVAPPPPPPAPEPAPAPQVDILDLVRRTIRGDFGNGDARRKALGDNYQKVQEQVNKNLKAGNTQWNQIRLM
jgi:hypothetical protein